MKKFWKFPNPEVRASSSPEPSRSPPPPTAQQSNQFVTIAKSWVLLAGAQLGTSACTSELGNFPTFHTLAAPECKPHFQVGSKILVKMVRLIIVKLLYTGLYMC